MEEQNFENHRRLVPLYHFLTYGLILVVFVLAAAGLVHTLATGAWIYSGIMPVMISIVLLLLCWYARMFATKVQDRTIRAEENLRHYVLTGKLLDPRLTMHQIVALRFAPDEEYLPLMEQAIAQNMRPHDIKRPSKTGKPIITAHRQHALKIILMRS